MHRYNILLNEAENNLLFNGIGIFYFAGFEDERIKTLSPNTSISSMSPDAKAGTLKGEPLVDEWQKVLDGKLSRLCISQGLPPSSYLATGNQSGVAKLIDGSEELNNLQVLRDTVEPVEKSIIAMIYTALDVAATESDVEISYGDLSPFVSRIDQLAAIEKEVALGLVDPAEIIAAEKGIDILEAKQIYIKNMEQQQAYSSRVGF
jgi:hypothetical protein